MGIVGGRLLALAALALLAACTDTDFEHGKSRQDFENLRSRTPPEAAQAEAPPIPPLQPILAAPPPPGASLRLVSVSVTDPNIPVRDVLLELARKVGVDIDLDPKITGGIIISARDRPFIDVVERICDMARLRYTFKNNILKVEPDKLYYETYNLDLLNTARTITTDFASSLSISSLIQGAGGGGGTNNSTTDISSKSSFDVWKEIEDNVKTILTNSDPDNEGKLVAAPAPLPTAAPAPQKQAPPPPAGVRPGAGGDSPAANAADYAAQTAAAASAEGGNAEAAVVANKASDIVVSTPRASGDSSSRYSINKQAGVLSVYGSSKQQKLIRAYLDKVIAKAGTQVLIEAKVLEIALDDQYNVGIDWQSLRQNLKGTGFGLSSLTPSTNTATALPGLPTPRHIPAPFGQFGLNAGFTTFGGDLAAMVNLVRTYGDVRTLSSPRLTAMNNQPATLKVAQNHVYFKLQATVTSLPGTLGSNAQTATYNSQLQTLPIGFVMTVLPSIDTEHGLVTLSLRPSVTAWPGATVSDPAVALSIASACGNSTAGACSPSNVANAISSASVPVVDVREMESVVTIPSGTVIVLGGLMQELTSKEDSGVPVASDVPVVGNLFKATADKTQVTELVVFLKATVVRGPETVDWADRDSYKNYVHDTRPLGF